MKLTRIKIRNLRCIEEVELRPKDYTSLIGPNNAGKSTVLRAIEIFLDQLIPSLDEWRSGHENEPIVIEGDFDSIQEWERKKPGISSLVYQDRIQLRMSVFAPNTHRENEKTEIVYESFKPEETIVGWPADDRWGGLDPAISALATGVGIDGKTFRSVANKEKVRTLVRERLPDRVTVGAPRWTSEGVSIPAALQQAIPEVQLIPAIRDPEKDAAPGAKTSFGLLLKTIIVPALSTSDEYNRLLSAVADLQGKLRSEGEDQLPAIRELAEDISNRLSALITAKVSLSMDPPDAQ